MSIESQASPQSELALLEHALGLDNAGGKESRQTTQHTFAVSYLRVSSQRQMTTAVDLDKDGNSVATQREATTILSRKYNTSIIKEFLEPAQSAQSIDKRKVFKELLKFLRENPQVKYVLIYARSRAFRNHIDAALTKRMLKLMDVRLISATDDFGEGHEAEAMEGITDIFNELQVRKSGDDIRDKLLHKVKNGGTVGRARIGYLNVRKDYAGQLVNTIDIDPSRAPLIRWAFEAYASGEYSIARLHRELSEQGLTTRPSKKWTQKMISDSQLAALLADPYYVGYIRYKGQLYKGRHEPLIPASTFVKVQSVLEYRRARHQRDKIHQHFLRGLLTCSVCHEKGSTRRLVFARTKGRNDYYDFFLCTGRLDNDCTLGAVRVADAEAAVFEEVRRLTIDVEELAELRREFRDFVTSSQQAEQEQRANYRRQLARLSVKEDNLLNLVADGVVASKKARERLIELAVQQDELRQKLIDVDDALERGAKSLSLHLDLLERPADYFQHSPDTERRRIVETFFKALRVGKEAEPRVQTTITPVLREPTAQLQSIRPSNVLTKQNRPHQNDGGDPETTNPQNLWVNGLHKYNLVGALGLEPRTKGL